MTKEAGRPGNCCCEGCFGMVYIPELDRRFILCNNPRSDHYGHILDARHACGEFAIEAPEGELINPETITHVMEGDEHVGEE